MNCIKYTFLRAPIFANAAVVMVWSAFAATARAAVTTLPGISPTNLANYGVAGAIICEISIFMFWILIALSVVFVLIAAYEYLFSAGEPDKVSQANKRIFYAAAAIAVALVSKGFAAIIITLFTPTGITPAQAVLC